ncbi:MAG: cytochrome c, partial [Bryobacteraceae bacterium]|nr:cytochrome c [Bryobacteraceae bacterium]
MPRDESPPPLFFRHRFSLTPLSIFHDLRGSDAAIALRRCLAAFVAALVSSALAGAADHPGKAIYQSACAACHGLDGRGEPRS